VHVLRDARLGPRGMQTFTSILVDIDATATAQPALDRAAHIARKCSAPLRIVDAMSAPAEARRNLRADLEDELMVRRRQQLARIAYTVRDMRVDTDILSGPPADALIDDVLRFGHDLLVRAHTRDLIARGPKPVGAVDSELFRRCPCPVWALGPGAVPQRPRTVCAVNATAEDPLKRRLNTKVVKLGLLLTRLQEGSLVLLHAWRPFGEALLYSHSTDEHFSAYLDDARRQSKQGLAHFAESFGNRLAGVRLELRRGDVEDVLAEFVLSEGIDLVVVGTVGRTGITRRLVGNTAERVLQRVPCSVLAVKPDEFLSPERVNESTS
jgi:universal stress protein E